MRLLPDSGDVLEFEEAIGTRRRLLQTFVVPLPFSFNPVSIDIENPRQCGLYALLLLPLITD